MVNFEVSAPGTLNIFGENVTCENHNGIMASMDRRNILKFKELKDGPLIILEFSDIAMYRAMNLQQFRNFYKRCTFDDTLSEQILEFISSALSWDKECQKKIGHMFFYLLVQVIHRENIEIKNLKPFQVSLHTQLRNQNFGGYASIAVCFTTCFLHWSHLRSDAQHSLTDDDRAKISMYAKSCDKIYTDCIFKSNVTVSIYGSMLRYHCNDSAQNEVLDNMPNMTIMLVDSGLTENPDWMKEFLKQFYPQIVNSILNSIRVISDQAFSVLKKIRDLNKEAATYSQDVSAQEKKLFDLIHLQQNSNKIFIEFSKEMKDICEIAQTEKLPGKCADFNYARYTYIWCPISGDTPEVKEMLLKSSLDIGGFSEHAIEVINLNCDGLKIE